MPLPNPAKHKNAECKDLTIYISLYIKGYYKLSVNRPQEVIGFGDRPQEVIGFGNLWGPSGTSGDHHSKKLSILVISNQNMSFVWPKTHIQFFRKSFLKRRPRRRPPRHATRACFQKTHFSKKARSPHFRIGSCTT